MQCMIILLLVIVCGCLPAGRRCPAAEPGDFAACNVTSSDFSEWTISTDFVCAAKFCFDIMASARLSTPTYFSENSYELYKKEVSLWETVTSVDKKQRAVHLLLALPASDKDKNGIRDKLLETVDIAELKADDGVEKLLKIMDTYLAKDTLAVKWSHFRVFESYEKQESETMTQYIANFDTFYQKLQKNMGDSLTLPPSILAFKLLNGAKLNDDQRMVVMTSMDFDDTTKLYDSAKKALKKFFGGCPALDDSGSGLLSNLNIKTEPTFYTSSSRGRGASGARSSVGGRTFPGQYVSNSSVSARSFGGRSSSSSGVTRQKNINPRGQDGAVLRCYSCDSYRHMGSACPGESKINNKGKDGNVLRCLVCESYRHLISGCPHSWESMAKQVNFSEQVSEDDNLAGSEQSVCPDHIVPPVIEPCTEPVILFTRDQSDLLTLNKEALYSGVLDSGCSSTVCGKQWLKVYLEGLPADMQDRVVNEPSNKVFQFGGELRIPSEGRVSIPGSIVGRSVQIVTDVVDSNIPLLFSKDSLKAMKAKVDYETDQAVIFGTPISLTKTSVGHHCVSLLPDTEVHSVINPTVDIISYDSTLKLHRQYGHPGRLTFVKHLKSAGVWHDELATYVDRIYAECNVCKQFSRTPSRPVVSLPLAYEFNEVVSMDLKYWRPGLWILHMVDCYSRFSQSVFITSKRPKAIIESVITNWVGVFGIMEKGVITDNGGEFCNSDMRQMSSLLNIELMTTAAEAPYQNGICERNHAVIDMILCKLIVEYPNSPLNVLLKWANMAKNSLQMWSGYSSYQIVFGSNPKLPNVMTDRVPALEDGTEHELYSRHISALHAARREFIRTEACGRIKRALRSRIRASETVFKLGDRVYYKRENSTKWLGPGKVIGQDGKIVYVTHGGYFVRVANSRIMLASDTSDPNSRAGLVDSDDSKFSSDIENDESDTPDEIIDSQLSSSVLAHSAQQHDFGQINSHENASGVSTHVHELPDEVANSQSTSCGNGRVPRALARLQDFNKPGKLEISVSDVDRDQDVEEVNSITVPVSEHNSPECIEAKKDELDKIKLVGVYDEVKDQGQSCISTKWVIVRKGSKIKARLVARGFEEDLASAVDSPTVAKPCVRMVLAIAASQAWVIKSTDIKSAFLQGQQIERDVFLKPPKESSTKQGEIWKLRRCLYGLNDAARQFYNSLSMELLKLGCVRNTLDPALFMVYHDSKLAGVLVSHVDDFLHAGNAHFDKVMDKLYARFQAGSIQISTFTYTGYHISQNVEDFSIVLDQHAYLQGIDVPVLKGHDKQAALSPEQQSLYRSYVGKLGWLVQSTRPDLSFQWLEASTKNRSATLQDLTFVLKTLLSAQITDGSIVFPNLGDYASWNIVVYSDASHANICDGTGSTGGCIIFLAASNRCSPLMWKASKLKRVCRSSAAAEGLSLSDALDEALFIRIMLCQMLGVHNETIPIIAYTDHEGLRANISNVLHPKVCDKRLKLEIANIRQSIFNGEVRDIVWCDSRQQLADCLTKRGANGMKLMKVLQSGSFQ